MLGGTRVLIINIATLTELMTWPFTDKTTVQVQKGTRLPDDTIFVKFLEFIEPSRVKVLLMSSKWEGHSSIPLLPPSFEYTTPNNQLILSKLDLLTGGKG